MAETVLPCAGDLSGAARNPGVPEMPHEGGVQRARSAALPTLQGPVPDRRRHPGDADRRSKTREGLSGNLRVAPWVADVAGATGLNPAATLSPSPPTRGLEWLLR